GVASWCTVITSAPAFANASIWRSGRLIIRCTSTIPPASWTCSSIDRATRSPIVIGGTKCPSMTSTWMTFAPAPMTVSTCSPSRAKSALRIDGATCGEARSSLALTQPTLNGGCAFRLRADLGEDPFEPGLGLAVHVLHGCGDAWVDRGDLRVQLVGHRAVGGVALAARAQFDQVHRLARVHVEDVADPVAQAERVRRELAV